MIPTFTRDWFSSRIPAFEEFVMPSHVGRKVQWLELGSHEGRSALWIVENILTHHESRIECVDFFAEPYGKTFMENVATVTKILWRQSTTMAFLSMALANGVREHYDAIYIDACHDAHAVLADVAMSWPLLARGGFMIFDDYHLRETDNGPKAAIDGFMACHPKAILIHKDQIVILKKP